MIHVRGGVRAILAIQSQTIRWWEAFAFQVFLAAPVVHLEAAREAPDQPLCLPITQDLGQTLAKQEP